MFKVDIQRENKTKTYIVWDKNELIETRNLPDQAYLTTDDTKNIDIQFISNGNGISLAVTHKSPVIISESEMKTYIEQCNRRYFTNTFNFMPVTEITERDYGMLYLLYKAQDSYKEQLEENTEIKKDLAYVKKCINHSITLDTVKLI